MDACPACGETLPADADADEPDALDPLTLNSETFEFDKLTYAERKSIKRVVAELVLLEDAEGDPEKDWTQDDLRLAFAIVCARRANPDFSIEDGMALTPAELQPAAAGPPTKPARKPRAARAGKAT